MDFPLKTFSILLVEDNQGDVRLIKEAFNESKVAKNFLVASDGEEAIELLQDHGHAESLPDLIMLDLNLPKKSGFDVLDVIKSNPELHKIPVVIFSSSRSDLDILRSYSLNANSYVTKPSEFSEFIAAVKSIEEFWFRTVNLPIN